jgi:hypothetical protein
MPQGAGPTGSACGTLPVLPLLADIRVLGVRLFTLNPLGQGFCFRCAWVGQACRWQAAVHRVCAPRHVAVQSRRRGGEVWYVATPVNG